MAIADSAKHSTKFIRKKFLVALFSARKNFAFFLGIQSCLQPDQANPQGRNYMIKKS
jgi:hypothetical protein